MIIRQPVMMFLGALRQVSGASAASEVVAQVREHVREFLRERPFELLEVAVMRMGRVHFVVSYIKPKHPVEGKAADDLWKDLDTTIHGLLGPVKTELIIAAESPFTQPLSESQEAKSDPRSQEE